MKNQKNWESIDAVFEAMESCGPYIVLRNFEELSDSNYYMSGHADIDCLCTDAKAVRKTLQAKRNKLGSGQNHGFVSINGQLVKFGFFSLGDKYYATKWEQKMLDTRIKNPLGFYTMNSENYFYSLIYHALLQKPKLSDEYLNRLISMGKEFGLKLNNEDDLRSCLYSYLNDNKYLVEYPQEPNVAVNYAKVPKEMLGKYEGWRFRRFTHKLVKIFAKIVKKVFKIKL